MDPLRSWLLAARPERALVVSLCSMVGSSYAYFDAQPGSGLLAHGLLLLGAFAAAAGVNLVDRAWDGLDPTSAVAAAASIALAALCGICLVPLSGSGPLTYGALAVALGALRRAPVIGPSAWGWPSGEIAVLVAIGPLAAMAGYASQARGGSFGALLAGVPAGLVAAAALTAPHRPGALDASALRWIAVMLPLLGAAAVEVAVRAGEYGASARAATLPLAVAAAAAWRKPGERGDRVTLACAIAALACIVAAFHIAAHE